MTTIEQIKEIFTVGAEFDGYYGNGERRGKDTVTKVSEKSCWIDGNRNSWNTIKEYFEKGIYRIPENTVVEVPTSEAEVEMEIHDEVREQIIVEIDCPHCGTHIEEVEITDQDDEIICTGCGESIEIVFYESMHDYVNNADLSYYEIADGEIRETPFVEEIKPFDDPNFLIYPGSIEKDGKWYDHVNFGENETSYLLESELCETVFLVYTEESEGHYVTDGRVYETEKEANE